jgi:formylglycine-generating enzyme required for sulfatase activity
MSFDLPSWKQATADRLQTIGQWLKQRAQSDAPFLLYGTLCGASLWPLVEAARAGQILPVMMALGSVAAGAGGNLLAEQVQRWKDRADEAGGLDEEEVAAWAAEHAAQDADLRQALDAILEALEAIPRAEAALGDEDRARFVAALRRELAQLGNLGHFEATLAQGPDAQAASGGSVVSGGPIQAPVATGRQAIAAAGHVIQAEAGAFVAIGETEGQQTAAQRDALARYLHNLRRLCNALPLAALAEEEGAHRRAEVTLNRVYISLNTTTQVPLTEEEKAQWEEERPWLREAARVLSALEVAAGEPRLVILGDPGSGKSTFVNYLAYLLAGARLGEGDVPEAWPHGPLLPVRILLRELAAGLPGDSELRHLSAEKRASRLVGAVWEHVEGELAATYRAEDALPLLEREVDGCRALVVFDGLDEVALERRELVRQAVEAFAGRCGDNRVLVTCRVRSYREQPPLRGFADVTLAPFEQEQIDDFIRRWYGTLADLGALRPRDARDRANNLRTAVRPLLELARNPLLLTTMAVVHTAQVELPRERARLYRRCVDVLLRRWHRHKLGQAALLEELGVNEATLLTALQDVACQAQKLGGTGQEGDLPRGEVLRVLAGHLGSYAQAERFLDYVDARAGLLVGRGGGGEPVYTFPHRTFQEYLAGCHLALGGRDFGRRLRGLLAEGDRWALAARLGAEHLLYNVGDLTRVLDAAYTLCPVAAPQEAADWRGVLWAGQFAVEAGRRKVEEDTEKPDGGTAFLARLVPRLVQVLREPHLGAIERAAAGTVLARLGDPRFRADAWYLPDEPLLGFVEVPAGPFLMGSDPERDGMADDDEQPQHEVTLPAYYVARYPVTVAQFRAFVEASGFQPDDPDCLRGVDNHPVVRVNWHEARAYCAWLTEKLRAGAGTPEPLATLLRRRGWQVRLPTEAEWEKAARGTDGRVYPWGDEPGADRANYGDSGLGATSAVGCFPAGASPYGVEDLSGNVWEWTQSLWGKDRAEPGFSHPYDPTDGREDLDDNGLRVLRGGAFNFYERFVRCASRYRSIPNNFFNDFGFQVVVAPVPSGL